MPGRRSVSLEPENIAVASPRRSTRIKINHQDSPLPAIKTTNVLQELPEKRTRRSSSIQEKTLSETKDDLKKNVDAEKPKTPARRTRRSISAQEEQKPVIKELSIKLRKNEIKQTVEEENEEDEQERKEQQTPPQDEVNLGGRPKRRVTRSMSKSPVSLKNAKTAAATTTAAAATAAPATRSRRLSLNDKQANDTKVPTLDIITETEAEVEKTEETNETDVLNNNKKQLANDEANEKNDEELSENLEKNETEKMNVSVDTKKETPEKSVENELNTSTKSPSPRRSSRVKAKVLDTSTEEQEKEKEEKILNVSVEKIEIMEQKVKELIEKETEKAQTKETAVTEEAQKNEGIQEKNEIIKNTQIDEEIKEAEVNNKIEEKQEITEVAENKKPEEISEEDADQVTESNISIVGSLNGSVIKKDKEEIAKKLLEDDERPQNISLVNDDGRSYSPIIPKANTPLRLNDSRKSLNSTCTSQKLDDSLKDTSQTMEPLQISMRDETTKDMSVNLDETKISNKSTPRKESVDVNDSIASNKSLDSEKKINRSTPIRTPGDDKENDDMNTSNVSKANSSKKKNKRASINQLREQILDDYIASFTAEKKRKRESLSSTELEESTEKSKKRRSSLMSSKTVSSCKFSEDEEDDSDSEKKNEFFDDEASVGTEDTPSIGSNEIIDEGESINSTNSECDSNDSYEHGSFVVDDDEVEDEELLSGTEDFLGSMQRSTPRRRVMKMVSDSEEEEEKDKLDTMSMEPYGGISPTNISEKPISSVDSDMESVKNRNEELSKQIEDGTLVPEVESKRKMDSDESEDDVIIIEEKNNVEEGKLELENSINEVKDQSTKEDTDESVNKEDAELSTKEEHAEESTKEEHAEESTREEHAEESTKEKHAEESTKEPNELNEKQDPEESTKEKDLAESTPEKEAIKVVEKDIQKQNDSITETTESKEVQAEEDKETKYKKLIEKYFDVTNKNRLRRQTIGETMAKTPKQSSRKRNTSLNIEITTNTSIKDNQNKQAVEIIEVDMGLKQNDDESNIKYEFNTSGVYKVSPTKTLQHEESEESQQKEDELMLGDFNDSLNDSLDLITTSIAQIIENKKSSTEEETPVKLNETPTSMSKKKRKKNKTELDTSLNLLLVQGEEEQTIEEPVEQKKRKSKDHETKTETTEESDTTQIPEISKRKKRKMKQDEVATKTDKQRNKKTKQSVSESESDLVNSSFQMSSSTDSEKENSMDKQNKNKRKKSNSQIDFNFHVEKCKVSPSKSELEYDTNYVAPKHRNIYKNLIKPSSSGFSGTSQFIIKDLISKVSHGIKKQKKSNVKLNKNSLTGMMNCPNWKETLFTDGIVKPASNFRKNKKK